MLKHLHYILTRLFFIQFIVCNSIKEVYYLITEKHNINYFRNHMFFIYFEM